MRSSKNFGVIRADEAYAKQELMQRMNISQKFWDKMIQDCLPFTQIGHARWVSGRALIEYLEKKARSS